jgi:hypothetical protein
MGIIEAQQLHWWATKSVDKIQTIVATKSIIILWQFAFLTIS